MLAMGGTRQGSRSRPPLSSPDRFRGERIVSCENGPQKHRDELEANWERTLRHQQPEQIEPLR